jgi:hypothetical protein
MAEYETDELMTCGHCGNVANRKVKAENIQYAEGWADPCGRTWRLLECPACTNIILTETYFEGEEPMVEYDVKILYPTARTPLPELPIEIAKEYEATLAVRRISANACAVLARRTLEAICKQQGATGGSLYQQLDSLLKSASIPPLLADIAHLGRQLGNLGAHFGKEQANDADIGIMLDFLETILEYLYVIPVKVASVKSRLIHGLRNELTSDEIV